MLLPVEPFPSQSIARMNASMEGMRIRIVPLFSPTFLAGRFPCFAGAKFFIPASSNLRMNRVKKPPLFIATIWH